MNDQSPLLRSLNDRTQQNYAQKLSKQWRGRFGFVLAVLILGTLVALLANHGYHHNREYGPSTEGDADEQEMIDDFVMIRPSKDLEWHPCFVSFQCARLTVPMNWNEPETFSPVHLALLRIPGAGPPSQSPLIYNTGTAGSSGVFNARFGGRSLQFIVGHDQDIIGFDARGVGESTPRIDCFGFPSNYDRSRDLSDMERTFGSWRRLQFFLTGANMPLIDETSDLQDYRRWETQIRAGDVGCQFSDNLYGDRSILKYASAPNTAYDMLRIVEKWDEWRATQVKEEDDTIDRSSDSKGKLMFMGLSYGSFIGSTFAAMFPDKVGRMVLDGVVDTDLAIRPNWAKSIIATDVMMSNFIAYCYEAKEKCPLYIHGDESIDIIQRFNSIVTGLKEHPLAGMHPVYKVPVTYNHQNLQKTIFQDLQIPKYGYPMLALHMARIAQYGSQIFKMWAPNYAYDDQFSPYCSAKHVRRWFDGKDAILAMTCNDRRYPLNESLADLQARYKNMSGTSSFADVWMTEMMQCLNWPVKSVDPPKAWPARTSSINTPLPPQPPINTSFPLLFISNTLDPITPLQAGFKMAQRFTDAGFLEVREEGHCSTAAVSLCAITKIGEYFCDGKTIPPPKGNFEEKKWLVCEADETPLKPWQSVTQMAEGAESWEAQAAYAWSKLQKVAIQGSRMEYRELLESIRESGEGFGFQEEEG